MAPPAAPADAFKFGFCFFLYFRFEFDFNLWICLRFFNRVVIRFNFNLRIVIRFDFFNLRFLFHLGVNCLLNSFFFYWFFYFSFLFNRFFHLFFIYHDLLEIISDEVAQLHKTFITLLVEFVLFITFPAAPADAFRLRFRRFRTDLHFWINGDWTIRFFFFPRQFFFFLCNRCINCPQLLQKQLLCLLIYRHTRFIIVVIAFTEGALLHMQKLETITVFITTRIEVDPNIFFS